MQIAAAMRHFTSFFMLVPSPPEDLARVERLAILGAADCVVTAFRSPASKKDRPLNSELSLKGH
jgi:hypothetical protein